MEKISLINPNWGYIDGGIFNRIWPPLCLAVSAALLEEKGFNVEIIDANALRLTPSEAAQMVEKSDKIFITTSSLDIWQCPHLNLDYVRELIDIIKKINKNSKVFLLGAHGTIQPIWCFKEINPDYIIQSEPEKTILKICEGADPEQTPSVTYFKDGKLVINELDIPLSLDEFPVPAFHLLPMDRYYYEIMGDKFTLLEASRGCPHNCIFCLKKMYCGYRTKSSENIISEIDYVVKEFNVKNIYFIDLEFTINRKLVLDVCNHLIEKNFNLKWTCQTRADSVNEDLLRLMKKAGCIIIHYGIETGSKKIMEKSNKNITLSQIKQGIYLSQKSGIQTAGFFMFGFPKETKEDMAETIEYAIQLNPTYASFRILAPHPGTQIYSQVDLDETFPFNLPEHDFNILRKMVKKATLKFYLRPGYMLSRLLYGNPTLWKKQITLFYRYITSKYP